MWDVESHGITAAARISQAQAQAQAGSGAGTPAAPATARGGGQAGYADEPGSGDDGLRDDPGGDGCGGGDGAGAAPGTGGAGPALPARSNLTLPLATLLGLADRPGLGPLDPALVRDLAATAARSPHSDWCVTITDASGYAIGHGSAKPARTKRSQAPPAGSRDGPWTFTRQDDPGPPGGFGTWLLTFPGGRRLTVKPGPVPLTACDHRHESHAYQPGDTLRHPSSVWPKSGQNDLPEGGNTPATSGICSFSATAGWASCLPRTTRFSLTGIKTRPRSRGGTAIRTTQKRAAYHLRPSRL